MKPNHVLIGSSSPPNIGGGIAAVSAELSKELKLRGMRVTYIGPGDGGAEWCLDNDMRWISHSRKTRQCPQANELIKYISRENVDLIINNDNSLVQSIVPAVVCPVVVIGHFQGRAIGRLATFNADWCDYVIAISNDMRRVFTSSGRVRPHKCPVVFNGISDPERDAQPQTTVSRGPGLRGVYVGGHRRDKGVTEMEQLVIRTPGISKVLEVDWFGSADPKTLRSVAGVGGTTLRGKVSRDQFIRALSQADLLLLPSRLEGCPMVLLEALSLGVVPIVSDGTGAMREIVRSGFNGFVCSVGRSWAVEAAHCIRYLTSCPDTLNEMKRRARTSFVERYRVGTMVDEILSLVARPTVRRPTPVKQISILKWHRYVPECGRPSALKRLQYRLGHLRAEGTLRLDSLV